MRTKEELEKIIKNFRGDLRRVRLKKEEDIIYEEINKLNEIRLTKALELLDIDDELSLLRDKYSRVEINL